MSLFNGNEENKFFENSKKKYVRKNRHPYKLYIPENLDIDILLNENPPQFNYYKDCFVYILHLISSVPMWTRDFDIEKQKGFTPINKENLSRRIHSYKRYIEYLKFNKIIIVGTSYRPGYYSTGIKFEEKYRVKLKSYYITKNTLIKSITEGVHNRDVEAESELSFLKKWFNPCLTINMDGVVSFLTNDMENERKKIAVERERQRIKKHQMSIDDVVVFGYNMKFMVADKIKEGKYLRLKIDNTSGRFHSPLTNLKKELKQYVKFDSNELCGIDIVNSQPLLSMILLDFDLFMKNRIYEIIAHYNNNFNDLKKYDKLSKPSSSISTMLVNLIKKCSYSSDVEIFKKAVIEGRFYEEFGIILAQKKLLPNEILEDEKAIRKYAKTAIFTAFFSKQDGVRWNKHIQAFRKCFPTVFRIFNLIKTGNGEKSHATMALLLQKFESNLVLHGVCKEINSLYPNAPLFTIHDSIASTAENIPDFKAVFKKHLFDKLEVNPQLEIENW